MTDLISVLAAGIVVLAFCLGIFIGALVMRSGGAYAGAAKNADPGGDDTLMPVVPDREKQRRFEEDLKAFEDTMNYSADIAYGNREVSQR